MTTKTLNSNYNQKKLKITRVKLTRAISKKKEMHRQQQQQKRIKS